MSSNQAIRKQNCGVNPFLSPFLPPLFFFALRPTSKWNKENHNCDVRVLSEKFNSYFLSLSFPYSPASLFIQIPARRPQNPQIPLYLSVLFVLTYSLCLYSLDVIGSRLLTDRAGRPLFVLFFVCDILCLFDCLLIVCLFDCLWNSRPGW